VTEYFDSVTSQIDLFIETQLQVNSKDEAKSVEINQKREVMLKAVREAEQLNMKHLNEKLVNDLDSLVGGDYSKLFVTFCFVLELNKSIQLILTEEYIPERELNLYRRLLCIPFSAKLSGDPIKQKLIKELFEFEPTSRRVNI
jgi:hypothetical protein